MRHTLLILAFLPVSFLWVVNAHAESSSESAEIEEIVVTGTYLERTAANSPSPISIISFTDIEDIGAPDAGEILQAMVWQSGSQVRTTTFGGEGAEGQISINLRSLGNASTLPLVNGKRHVASFVTADSTTSVDINAMIPTIAIERIEIVKDGSSALYGSDAVAGVVNFLTRRDFDGFEAQIEASTDEETRRGDMWNLSAILGRRGDSGGLVLSAGVLRRDEINVDDRYADYGGTTASTVGQPGRFLPTQGVRWANGEPARDPANPNNPRLLPRDPAGSAWGNADLDCENDAALERGGTLGLYFGNNICAYDFGSFFPIQADEKYDKVMMTGDYVVSEHVELYIEAAASRSEFERLNSWAPNRDSPIVPVDNPGLLEDAARRGIMPQPLVNGSRTLGGTRNTPFGRRPVETSREITRHASRLVAGIVWDLSLGPRQWQVEASLAKSWFDGSQVRPDDTRASQLSLALAGFGGPNCDPLTGAAGAGNVAFAATGNFDEGTCYFFNPFGNHQFDADGNFQGVSGNNVSVANGALLQNPAELYQWLQGSANFELEFANQTLDLVLTGDVVDTASGPIGLALGFQHRRDDGKFVPEGDLASGNLSFQTGVEDFDDHLTVRAAFAEVAIPMGRTLDFNVAVRHEDFVNLNESSTDPKVSVLWRPLDSLSVRGSWGTSFRVGSLGQIFGSPLSIRVQVDPLFGSAGVPIVDPADPDRVLAVEAGIGTELEPETAEMFNVGISWAPEGGGLDGFRVDVDYYEYDYTDLITRESPERLLREDAAAFVARQQMTGAPIQTLVAESVACFRQTGDGDRCVGNPRQVIRDSTGRAVAVDPQFINANNLDVAGVDIDASYTWEMASSLWRAGLQAAWIRRYDIGIPRAGGEVTIFDGAGSRNAGNEVGRPLPEWKINGTLSWRYADHRVFLIAKYVDGYRHDTPQNPLLIALAARELGVDLNTPTVESHVTFDVHYTYTLPEVGVQTSGAVTVGLKNAANKKPPLSNQTHMFEPTLHDPLGRVWYLRYSMRL